MARPRKPTKLPRAFVVTVGLGTIGGWAVFWFWFPLTRTTCEMQPCDGPGMAAIGVVMLGLSLLAISKIFWVIWVRVRKTKAASK